MKVGDLLDGEQLPRSASGENKGKWRGCRVAGCFTALGLAGLLISADLGRPATDVLAAEAARSEEAPVVPGETPKQSRDSDFSKTGSGGAGEVDQPSSRPNEGHSAKLIPDQRAFLGSPDTLIDLADVFRDTEVGRNAQSLKMEVLRSKKDVAEAVIEGTVLRLKWGAKIGKKREILVRATTPEGVYVDTKFHVQLWQPDYWKLILTVIGGLGIFLLGMKSMSEGLQAIAGARLRRLIGVVADNRLIAAGTGTLVTMLVQSSSITTVMVVGFVNSGLMTLSQAVGVIMGANIGTTITGWILVLKVGVYGLPLAGGAAFVYLFAKRDRWRYTALACMGLGMIFLGLELMKDGFGVIKELPEFEAWFHTFEATSYVGVLKCALVGCVLTLVVQSSSATLGITIGLAQIGVIQFETAAALVLGENIGTTITAWLASFGSTTNAKRAAYFHVLFNSLGVVWITAAFPWYIMFIRYFITGDANTTMSLENVSAAEITAGIAATHTGFNIANTIMFLPLVGVLTSLLQRFIPERKADDEQAHLTNLDVRMLESPTIAIDQSRAEVLRMAVDCRKMMDGLRRVLTSNELDEERVKTILQLEDDQDAIQQEIVGFLSNLFAANVPHEVIDEARRQLRMADEYESASDCIATILKAHRRLHRIELRMPKAEMAEILELHDMVDAHLAFVSRSYEERRSDNFRDAIAQGETITKHAKGLVKRVLAKMPDESLVPQITVAFNRQVAAYRRVRDHLVNVAEAWVGEK